MEEEKTSAPSDSLCICMCDQCRSRIKTKMAVSGSLGGMHSRSKFGDNVMHLYTWRYK